MANPGTATTSTTNTVATYNGLQLLFILPFANMAIAAQDQQFTRVFGGTTWDPQFITAIWKAGAFATACTSGIFTLPGKGGNAIVATSQSYSALTGANTHTNCVIQASTTTFTATPFLNLTTANSGTLVAEFRIYGFSYD